MVNEQLVLQSSAAAYYAGGAHLQAGVYLVHNMIAYKPYMFQSLISLMTTLYRFVFLGTGIGHKGLWTFQNHTVKMAVNDSYDF